MFWLLTGCRFLFFLSILSSLFLFSLTPEGRAEHTMGQRYHRGRYEEKFNNKRSWDIAQKIAKKFLSNKFFLQQELPVKATLGVIDLNVDEGPTAKFVTDHTLNALLEYSGLFIVNQDPSLGFKIDYSLISYESDSDVARKRGMLMGADYFILGSVKQVASANEKGKMFKHYEATLTLKDIRSSQTVAHEEVRTHKQRMKDK